MLVLLFGPSGSGKTTLKNSLLVVSKQFSNIICTTTRQKREGEQNGNDYYFVSKEDFTQRSFCIEFCNGENYYGIETKELFKKNGIVAIDLSLSNKIKEVFSQEKLMIIYINPTEGALKRRMLNRGDNIYEINKRLKRDRELNAAFDITSFNCPYMEINNENKKDTLKKVLSFLSISNVNRITRPYKDLSRD